MSLNSDRRVIVENIYNDVELPEGIVIESASGWEHVECGRENNPVMWVRPLFLQNPENSDGDTITQALTVIFYANSVEVKEVSLGDKMLKVPSPY